MTIIQYTCQWIDCVQVGDGRMGINNLKTRVHVQVSH
jgi:hypothetical protein